MVPAVDTVALNDADIGLLSFILLLSILFIDPKQVSEGFIPVSYTHLTLPTMRTV